MAARQTGTARSGTRTGAKKGSASAGTTKKGTGAKRSTTKKTASGKGASAKKGRASASKDDIDYRQRSGMYDEIELIIALAVSILLLLSIYDLCGTVGNHISYFIFGVFGCIAFLIPYMVFFGTAFYISNRHSRIAVVKIISGIVVFITVAAFLQMITNPGTNYLTVLNYFEDSAVYKNGGGLVGGSVCRLLTPLFGIPGTYLIIAALFAVSIVLFAGKSVFVAVAVRLRNACQTAAKHHRERAALMNEAREQRRLEEEEARRFAPQEDDFDDIDDYEDIEEEMSMQPEKKVPRRKRRKKAGVDMIEPENAYGESVSPIGFALPKPDEKAASEATAAVESEKSDVTETEADHASSMSEPEFPDLTITRMEPVKDEDSSDFEFTPDPVYLSPEALNIETPEPEDKKDSQPLIDIPDFMQKQPEVGARTVHRKKSEAGPLSFTVGEPLAEPSPFDKTQPLPVAEIESALTEEPLKDTHAEENHYDRFDDLGEVKDIRERSIEEKYTNLPDYVPGQADVSPAQAVKRAAGKAGGEAMAIQAEKAPSSKTGKSDGSKGDDRPEPVTDSQLVPAVKEYVFPPIELLKRGKPMSATGDSDAYLKETAKKLQETLDSFGVKVHVTNVSCGPSVTRYELSPEQGVKVSKILSLTDDIKLNLAVADIRIEAPIPGKAAVGIEVPNKENTTVMLRDLLESNEFKMSKSLIAFAVGRDIGGQVIIADIAKMPHLLIAGATGSGKSVCINTLIMSIIYRAKPEDVRLIMIDPKVVELSVYNGIPHLLIPVVTDPKKAAGALNWAVAEMDKRYKKFAQLNVRDMKSYNAKIEAAGSETEEHQRLPQIVIIVDELADLMMVASNEVEDAICRLAQLARAAGIHLVIATQRPSVNVITGLIKANIPSRIAFSVSSGVDSRTIIDMNGAEKLLGKGDMLFYPTGYQKPVRVQGAFVSDDEVNAVVDFLTKDQEQPVYNESIVSSISSGALSSEKGSAPERDVYFVEAGRMIIEKDKASIGMLQRVYRIGFNRAARIMDQLCEAGVVGPEEGTKPRKVLMSPEEFEQYVEDYV
ncbi:MAG TPA: DNA translocase FtsK 4TM domain-containing protein [Candidatus Scybalocola faecavium]|nr:DNA translocase FtsK 4TM domain-containing protein [Candidatus Scybalocola faecavium]